MSEPTKEELYEKAQEADIEGRSAMSKEELAAALAAHEDADDEAPVKAPASEPQTPAAAVDPTPARDGRPAEPTRPLGMIGLRNRGK